MPDTLAERLVKLRKYAGLSQYEFADAIGMSRNGICNYENKKRVPDAETIIKIAKYFKVTTDYLLGLDDCKSHENQNLKNEIGLTDEAINALIFMLKEIEETADTDYKQYRKNVLQYFNIGLEVLIKDGGLLVLIGDYFSGGYWIDDAKKINIGYPYGIVSHEDKSYNLAVFFAFIQKKFTELRENYLASTEKHSHEENPLP